MSAQDRAERARLVLHALYAKHAAAPVLRRAERVYHRAACDAYIAKYSKDNQS